VKSLKVLNSISYNIVFLGPKDNIVVLNSKMAGNFATADAFQPAFSKAIAAIELLNLQ